MPGDQYANIFLSLSQRVFKTKKSPIVKTKEFSSFENGPKSVVHYSVSRLPNAQNAHFLFLGQCPKVPKSAQSAQKTTTENKIGILLTYGCLYVFPVLSLFEWRRAEGKDGDALLRTMMMRRRICLHSDETIEFNLNKSSSTTGGVE